MLETVRQISHRIPWGLPRRALLPTFWIAATSYYVFLLTAGNVHAGFASSAWSTYYDAQAEGFRAGHLYLPEIPSAELRALADPLNPANARWWRWDYSYKDGHFYLYWGQVPALLLAAVKAILAIRHPIGDHVLVFAFVVGRAVFGTLLIRALPRALLRRPPEWAVWMSMLVFVLANPIPFVLNRAAIYEASILAGNCFTVAGLYFALSGLCRAREPGGVRWLAGAGLCFGLAAGSRSSLLPASGLLTAITIFAGWRLAGGGARRFFANALAAGIPAFSVVLTQLALNFLRFGNWLEFGLSYTMSFQFRTGLRFLPANLYRYLAAPLGHSCRFPFVLANWPHDRSDTPLWVSWPKDFQAEPAIGILLAIPFSWLLLIAAPLLLVGPRGARPDRRSRWLRGALVTSGALAVLPLLTIFYNSMRYELDFTTGVLLAATLAGWSLMSAAQSPSARAGAISVYAGLALSTVLIGILLGFGGYYDHFAVHNPRLWARLQSLHVCSGR